MPRLMVRILLFVIPFLCVHVCTLSGVLNSLLIHIYQNCFGCSYELCNLGLQNTKIISKISLGHQINSFFIRPPPPSNTYDLIIYFKRFCNSLTFIVTRGRIYHPLLSSKMGKCLACLGLMRLLIFKNLISPQHKMMVHGST